MNCARRASGSSECRTILTSYAIGSTIHPVVGSKSASLNNGEDQVRGVGAVVIDAVDRLHEVPFRFRLNRSSCVGVAIKAREVGACDLQADTMPRFKNL